MRYLIVIFLLPALTINKPKTIQKRLSLHERLSLIERMLGITDSLPAIDYVIEDSTQYLIIRPRLLRYRLYKYNKYHLMEFDSIIFIDGESSYYDTITVWDSYNGNR